MVWFQNPFYNIQHSDFNFYLPNDAALLELSQPAVENYYVRTAMLPTKCHDFTGQDCVALGWGKTQGEWSSSSPVHILVVFTLANISIYLGKSESFWEGGGGSDLVKKQTKNIILTRGYVPDLGNLKLKISIMIKSSTLILLL